MKGLWLVAVVVFVVVLTPLSIWTDRTLDFWVSYIRGSPVDVPFVLSLLVTIVGNGVILLVNVVSEVARLCV